MLIVRPAGPEDSLDTLNWRNDPISRQFSLNQNMITVEEHMVWYARVLADSGRILLIGLDGQDKIGVVHFYCENDVARVSINLNPQFRGQDYGRQLLLESEAFLPREVRRILADIKDENEPSKRAFEKAGYRPNSLDGNLHAYLKSLT
jgi:RimJ/RimL family protein N-acetyltransferase